MTLPWEHIETVFLDMDGTLLDLYFDNHFWLEHVPTCFAQKHQLGLDEAKQTLYPRFKSVEGTMNWYCIDYWTHELGLDIAALKAELEHLIKVRPKVRQVLETLQKHDKRIALLTNAHHKVVELKMRNTGLAIHFDELISSHSFAYPKEDPNFWPKLAQVDKFKNETTLFVDDSLPVLRAAQNFGIKHLRAIHQPDSKAPPKNTEDFIALKDFEELIVGL